MGVFNKIKNFFVEEVEEDEDDEEEVVQQKEPEEEQLARKVEVPKKSFRERFKLREKLEEDEEDEKKEDKIELEEQEPNVYIPKNNDLTFEEEKINPVPEKETTIEEVEEDVLPSRSSRIPLVFEDDNLFQEDDYKEEEKVPDIEIEEEEEEEPAPPPKEKYKPPLLYQGRKESNYIDSIKKETYNKPKRDENSGDKKFRPSPIISPIYGILDKNYKKEEIKTKIDTSFNSEKKEKAIDNIRKKAYGEEKKEEVKEEVTSKTEKKVNINRETPTVSKVTIADADEYYNDLGLAYNVDYKDMSRSQTTKKKEEPKTKDEDNLFDLIDSMYNKKED